MHYFNASLASFVTEKDFDLFKSHIIHNELSVSNALIGLIRQQHGSYAWKDASPVTFLNWAEDEPSDIKGRIVQQCVKMQLYGNYSWNSISCWQSTHYLCSVPVENVHPNSGNKNDEMPSSSHLSNDKKRNSGEEMTHDSDSHTDKISANNHTLSSMSPSQSSSAVGILGEICLTFIIVLSVIGGIQLWKRKRRLRLSNQRIVQFDQLQNEEENIM